MVVAVQAGQGGPPEGGGMACGFLLGLTFPPCPWLVLHLFACARAAGRCEAEPPCALTLHIPSPDRKRGALMKCDTFSLL